MYRVMSCMTASLVKLYRWLAALRLQEWHQSLTTFFSYCCKLSFQAYLQKIFRYYDCYANKALTTYVFYTGSFNFGDHYPLDILALLTGAKSKFLFKVTNLSSISYQRPGIVNEQTFILYIDVFLITFRCSFFMNLRYCTCMFLSCFRVLQLYHMCVTEMFESV